MSIWSGKPPQIDIQYFGCKTIRVISKFPYNQGYFNLERDIHLRRFFSLLIAIGMLLGLAPIPARAAAPIQVYYAGPEGALKTALALSPDFQLGDSLELAQVIVLNGSIPDPEAIARRARAGAGVFLAAGPELRAEDVSRLLGTWVDFTTVDQATSPVAAPGDQSPIQTAVIWASAPQVMERIQLDASPFTALVEGFEDQALLLGSVSIGAGKLVLLTPVLSASQNVQFQQWAYFNYFVYAQVTGLANQAPLSFGDYPGSPVPHRQAQLIIMALLAAILVVTVLVFRRVRRYSLAHPEALDALVKDRVEYKTRQESTAWDAIGFHRPLGGFMLAFMVGVILFIPLIIYQNLILPTYILPSAQALGIWGRVTQFFSFLWQLFDMGTAAAFVKFFSEYRVHDPRKGIQYGQIYIWWQLLSGALQVAMVAVVASIFLPETPYALYAWSVIIHSLIQIPGFLGVMRLALNGYQRSDYAQILTMGTEVLLPILVQPVFVTLMVVWGRSNPVFGESMGGLLGMGISAYFIQVLAFLLGLWLYRRLGYNIRVLFLAHFDWSLLKSAFRFGVFEMLGSVAWAIGQAMEIVVTQTRLVNYAEIWGNWGLAQNFIFSFSVISALYDNLMPSISEAISNGKRMLSQYYSVMAYKWGGMMSAYIGAVLLAVADRFILGASGPQFSRAALYAIPLIIWGAIQYPSWVGDNVQLGANRPYLKTSLIAGEQIIRISLAFLLIESLQVTGLIVAYFVGLLTKGIVSYFINNRVCFRQRFYFWQSLAAPLLAGGVHYLLLRWLTGLIWQGDQVTSIAIFFLGILPSYPIFAFLYGLFGGWDADTLEELHQSIHLSSFMEPLAWLFWKATALGTQISPLHGRFPISIRPQALEDARSLMEERIPLA
jgi:O-antigen/teichoic acid export membrane protein